jgi:hypothetical protein
MDTSILSSEIREQLTPSELDDILAGAKLCFAQSHDEDALAAFLQVSLLALGFDNGKRAN